MSCTLSLPPSARDFEIYQRLMLDGASTRQVASDCSLSQTRVRQIVSRVAHWMAQSLPPSSEAMDASYLRLAQHIAADRLQFLYGEAMHGWRATHQAKFTGVILRVTAALGKLPAIPGTLDALLADALEGPLPDDDTLARSASAGKQPPSSETSTAHKPCSDLEPGTLDSSPPSEDCSPRPISVPPATPTRLPATTVTPSHPMTSSDMPPAKSAARRAFLSPARPESSRHTPCAAADAPAAITELKITPQTLGFTTQKPMSRRDRRRLRRLANSK